MGLIERHEDGNKFRLSENQIEEIEFSLAVFEDQTINEIDRTSLHLTKNQIQELIDAAVLAVEGDDLCCLRNIIEKW